MKHRPRSQFRQPTLVPLADMLTNTVGIVIFILVFIVLAAGGAASSNSRESAKETERLLSGLARVLPRVQSDLETMSEEVDRLLQPEPSGVPTAPTSSRGISGDTSL